MQSGEEEAHLTPQSLGFGGALASLTVDPPREIATTSGVLLTGFSEYRLRHVRVGVLRVDALHRP